MLSEHRDKHAARRFLRRLVEVAGTTHVRSELVYLIKVLVESSATELLVPQVTLDEIVGSSVPEPRELEVYAPHPEAVALQASNQMAADKPTGSADDGSPS